MVKTHFKLREQFWGQIWWKWDTSRFIWKMCFWDLLWVGNMKLSQSIQKCMFEILTIETPYEIIAISAIFEQNLLLKKKTLENSWRWGKILVCNSSLYEEATLHTRIFDLRHFCGRDFFLTNFEFFQDFRLSRPRNLSFSLQMISW